MDGFLDDSVTNLATPFASAGVPATYTKDAAIFSLMLVSFFVGYYFGKD